MINKNDDKSTWAIGGGILGGIGLGLLYHSYNLMAIPAFTILGLGLGLIITSIISSKKGRAE